MPRHHPRKSSVEFSRKRTKMRYFVGEVVCVTPQHQMLLDNAIKKSKTTGQSLETEMSSFLNNLFCSSYGAFGSAILSSQTFFHKQNKSLTIMYYNEKLHFFVMRMEKFLYKQWRDLLVLVQKIKLFDIAIPCLLRINYVGPTINRAKEYAIDYQLKIMRQLQWSSQNMEKQVTEVLKV